ncbi:MAG: cell division protein FtsQ/DivIB [Bauldia sp.]|nr:cell division protein FtsQ/DivIB [Bauldia sp.]
MSDWPAEARPAHRVVLPRFLRRPARILSRLDLKVPRHAGTKGMALLFAATAVTGMVIGGHTTTVISALTSWAGLAIDEVEISGQSETSEIDVLNAMAIGPFPSIVTFDAISARERVEQLPWVKRVTIRKLYPDTLQVAIVERQPYAIWQHDGAVALITKDGKVLSDHVDSRYAQLPMVVGKGADARAGEFVALLEEFPTFAPRVRAGVLVSDRRWNVVLDNGVEIMLPADDPGSALIQAVALDDGHGIFSREIAAVDLRLPNRLVFRLTEAGYEAREALLKHKGKG